MSQLTGFNPQAFGLGMQNAHWQREQQRADAELQLQQLHQLLSSQQFGQSLDLRKQEFEQNRMIHGDNVAHQVFEEGVQQDAQDLHQQQFQFTQSQARNKTNNAAVASYNMEKMLRGEEPDSYQGMTPQEMVSGFTAQKNQSYRQKMLETYHGAADQGQQRDLETLQEMNDAWHNGDPNGISDQQFDYEVNRVKANVRVGGKVISKSALPAGLLNPHSVRADAQKRAAITAQAQALSARIGYVHGRLKELPDPRFEDLTDEQKIRHEQLTKQLEDLQGRQVQLRDAGVTLAGGGSGGPGEPGAAMERVQRPAPDADPGTTMDPGYGQPGYLSRQGAGGHGALGPPTPGMHIRQAPREIRAQILRSVRDTYPGLGPDEAAQKAVQMAEQFGWRVE